MYLLAFHKLKETHTHKGNLIIYRLKIIKSLIKQHLLTQVSFLYIQDLKVHL